MESAPDPQILLEECARRFKAWKPDIIIAPTTRNDKRDYETIEKGRYPSRRIDRGLHKIGIVNTKSNIYRAPDTVKAALNINTGLFNVHFGDDQALGNQELFTPDRGNISLAHSRTTLYGQWIWC